MSRILQISVFYKNDDPNGFGFSLGEEFGDLDFIYQTTVTQYEIEYREAVHQSSVNALTQDMFRQLDTIGQTKVSSLEAVLIALGNVYILERYQFLKSDDFNGLLIARY
jgi:hypothetical protein